MRMAEESQPIRLAESNLDLLRFAVFTPFARASEIVILRPSDEDGRRISTDPPRTNPTLISFVAQTPRPSG
jgi:hypothetical protein